MAAALRAAAGPRSGTAARPDNTGALRGLRSRSRQHERRPAAACVPTPRDRTPDTERIAAPACSTRHLRPAPPARRRAEQSARDMYIIIGRRLHHCVQANAASPSLSRPVRHTWRRPAAGLHDEEAARRIGWAALDEAGASGFKGQVPAAAAAGGSMHTSQWRAFGSCHGGRQMELCIYRPHQHSVDAGLSTPARPRLLTRRLRTPVPPGRVRWIN